MPHDPQNDTSRQPSGETAAASPSLVPTQASAQSAHEELVPSEPTGRAGDIGAVSPREASVEQASGAGYEGPDEASGDVPIREEVAVESEHQVRVRRTPRYGRFMILGGAIFAVAAFIVTYSFPQEEGYDRNTVFGFVLLASVAVGVGLGALAAIIASAATRRTERTVTADRIDVRQTDASSDFPELPDLGELPAEPEVGDERQADAVHAEPADETASAKRDAE